MSHIIAGHFQLQDEIDAARTALQQAGFPDDRIAAFYLNQPGQHDTFGLGGDRDKSPGAKESGEGVAKGVATGGAVGAAIGAATSVVTGPLGPVVGALVGGHVGSLYSLSHMKEAGESEDGGSGANELKPRKAGMMIAVALAAGEEEARAVEVLRRLGARDLEQAEGTITAGDWKDFNPLSLPLPLGQNAPAPAP